MFVAFLMRACAVAALLLDAAVVVPAHRERRRPTAPSAPSRQVSLYATVEKRGGLVSGLNERNFHLYEDGEVRAFRLEEPESTFVLALLVEYSRSPWMCGSDLASAAQGFFDTAPAGHWHALATFSNTLTIEVDLTRQRGKIPLVFSDLGQPFWSEINAYDALWEILDKLERLPGRRVLVFVGSGFDTLSSRTLDDVRDEIERANVTVYGAGAGSVLRGQYDPYLETSTRMTLLQAGAFIRMLADKSGGEAWLPRFESAFPDVRKGIMQSLAHQYRLAYDSRAPRDGKLHQIRLEAFRLLDDQREDFRVWVREGWRR